MRCRVTASALPSLQEPHELLGGSGDLERGVARHWRRRAASTGGGAFRVGPGPGHLAQQGLAKLFSLALPPHPGAHPWPPPALQGLRVLVGPQLDEPFQREDVV